MAITPDAATAATSGAAPAPTPTDSAPTQAQAPATAPVQPTATAAPAQGTTPTPSTTQSGLPGAPTTDATAVATAHPTSVLRGALMGILGAAAKVGRGVEKVGEATGAGQSIVRSMDAHKAAQTTNAGAIAKQQQDAQAAKDAQQKAQDEHIAAGDTHSEMPLRMNILSNTAVGTALSNSVTQENLSQTQVENTMKNNAADAQVVQILKDEGAQMDEEHGVGFDNLNANHAKDITSGNVVALNNGQTGDNHGIVLVHLAQAGKTPLTKDRQVVTDWKVDPKTGAMSEVYSTLPAGTSTVMDVLNAKYTAAQKFAEKSQIADQIQKQNTNAADVREKGAAANKSNAEARNQDAQAKALAGGITPQNQNLTGDDFIKTLPAGMQSVVESMKNYNMDSKDLPRGKEKLPYITALTHAFPDWSEANYQERHDYLKEYGSSTKGDGATRNRLNTAVGHLAYLDQANDALSQNNLPALVAIANKLGVAAGRTPKITYDAIASKAAGEIAGAIKGGGAAPTDPEIESARKSFSSDQGAAQRKANIDAQWGLLDTQVGTIHDGFTNKMGRSPEQFGQPVLFGNSQQILDQHLHRGPAQILIGGKPYTPNAAGNLEIGGYEYKPKADGTGADLIGPVKR